MKTITLAVFNLLVIIPVILICKWYYKFLESCIYLGSGIVYYIGKVICQDPDSFEEYLNMGFIKMVAEALGFIFTIIGISMVLLTLKIIISWI